MVNYTRNVFMDAYKIESGSSIVSVSIHYTITGLLFDYADTKPSEKFSSLVRNQNLCTDIKKLSTTYQTSRVEAFHSVIIHYAPKLVAFSYAGMKAR